jgi:two-component system, NtrC family, sensor kinase
MSAIAEAEWGELQRLASFRSLIDNLGRVVGFDLTIEPGSALGSREIPSTLPPCALDRPADGVAGACPACRERAALEAVRDQTFKVYACQTTNAFVVPVLYHTKAVGFICGTPTDPRRRDAVEPAAHVVAIAEHVFKFTHELRDFLSRYRAEERTVALLAKSVIDLSKTGERHVHSEVQWTERWRAAPKRILLELRNTTEFVRASLQWIQDDRRTLLAGLGFDDESEDRRLLRPVSHDPLIAPIVSTGRPMLLADTEGADHWQSLDGTRSTRSWIGVPVTYGGAVIALLTLDHEQPGYYTEAEVERVREFVARRALTIWHSGFLNDAARFVRKLQIVSEVTEIISTELRIAPLLATIAREIAVRLRCSHCTIFLAEVDSAGQLLRPYHTYGAANDQTLTRTFRANEGFAGWVLAHGLPALTGDAERDERFAVARERQQSARSMVLAPIKVGDQTLGVISADQDAENWFGPADQELLVSVAKQAGIAIQRSRTLKLLEEIGARIITPTTVEEILLELIKGAILITNTTTGIIYLMTEDGRRVAQSVSPGGYDHPAPRLHRRNGLTRTIVETGKEIPIPDTKLDRRVHPTLQRDFTSIIGVPLHAKDRVIGVFYLNDRERHVFTETETSVLKTLATQAAIALQNAAYLEGVRQQVRIHTILENLLRDLRVYEDDRQRALQTIAQGIQDLLGDNVSVGFHLRDEQTGTLGLAHAFGLLKKHLDLPPREHGTGHYVLETRQPLYQRDVTRPGAGEPHLREGTIALGVKSFAAIPLNRQDQVVGVLFVHSPEPLEFTDSIKRALATCAGQAGVAIQIAILHEVGSVSALMRAADVGFLMSGVVHEFNRNLQNMKIHVYNWREAGADPERYRHLDAMNAEIENATIRIDTFRAFAGAKDAEAVLDVAHVVTTLLDTCAQQASDHGIELRRGRMDRQRIRASEQLVDTVFTNLLRNAMEAVAKPGPTGRRCVEVAVVDRHGQVEVSFADSGGGISPTLSKERIFQPFFTTKATAQNMGIGLHQVRRMVTKLGGTVDFDHLNEMSGATFRVVIPTITTLE